MPKGYPNKKPTPPAKQEATAPAPIQPAPPSPAVLALQHQVVELVALRTDARQKLAQAHTAYLLAQGTFQAAQAEIQGVEQEVSYRIGLIAQLENRAPTGNVLQMPPAGTIPGVSVDQAPIQHGSGYENPSDMINRGHASRDPNHLVSPMM